jgi:hypothetical protein
VKDVGEMQNHVYLAAGWNILVEVGMKLDRCRTQFKLVQSITENDEQMIKLVEKL